jgi:hypothetical protein
MDEFIDKAILFEFVSLNEKETLEHNFINTFYQNKDIKCLQFINIDDGPTGTGIFKYKNDILCYDIDYNIWSTMYYEILNTNTKDKCKLVKLLPHSIDNIEYTLHPFQTTDDEIYNLNTEYLINSEEIIIKEFYREEFVVDWKDGYKLYVNMDNTYIIKKDDMFISGFKDKDCHFQIGDSSTTVSVLKNGDLIIYNNGDVCSCVIIRTIQ